MTRLQASSGDRGALHREGLLSLARLLVAAHHGGTFSDSLEIVAESLGVDAAAAYEVDRDELVLVAHRGLSLDLRTALERLPRRGDPWFIAARAAKSRRLLVEDDVAASTSNAEVAALFQAGPASVPSLAQGAHGPPSMGARLRAVAVPLVSGRETLGVFVFFHRRAETFDPNACVFLETAAGLLTLARKAEKAGSSPVSFRHDEARMGPLAMAGMLAAHFADDVRGPLAAIALALREQERVLARTKESGKMPAATGGDTGTSSDGIPTPREVPPLRPLIEEAQLALARARTVTDQIVSAAQAGPKVHLRFADVLRDAAVAIAPAAAARGVTLVQQIEGEGYVLGRRYELVPAFVAMMTNAVQACEHGPRTRPPTVKITMEDDPRGVAVSIEDTGAGVSADLRSRIFDPFFSTNDGASGIGLTLAKHAIVGHSGHLELAMSPSLGGALFRAVLPRAAGTATKRRTSLSSATLRQVASRPTLLWIDRDDVFLASARRALDNFEIRTVPTAAEGEQLVLHGQPPPEIVFCELDLPDRSGIDLHASIARKNADLANRFVFVTDGILSPERAAYVMGSGCPTLVKPLDLDDIRALVLHASGESPSSRQATTPRRGSADVDDPFDF